MRTMTTVESSPTKAITDSFQRLKLSSAGDQQQDVMGHNYNSKRCNSETLTSAKNHLHIPQLIFNQDFANESKVGNMTENLNLSNEFASDTADLDLGEEEEDEEDDDEDGTVVHNRGNGDTKLPDWMAVKLRMQGAGTTGSIARPKLANKEKITHVKPKLVSSVVGSESDDGMDETNMNNQTWEEMKNMYDIDQNDISNNNNDNNDTSDSDMDNTTTGLKPKMNYNDTSAYSFQDMNEIRIISNTQSSSNGTRKVTSFKSNYIDSPMAPPKVIKSIPNPSIIKRPEIIMEGPTSGNINKIEYDNNDNNNENNDENKIEIQLITPVEQNMKFDTDSGKWVYGHEDKKNKQPKYDDILHIEDDYDDEKSFPNKKNIKFNGKFNEKLKPTVKYNNSTILDIDPQQVTNVSQLEEISFSESRKTLIKMLTSVIKMQTNWDEVEDVDLTRRNLITVNSLREFLPNLTNIKLDYNNITTIDGLSTNLQNISLSHNKLSDDFINFVKFNYLHKLDLSFNKITNMSNFQSLRNLRELNLSNNQIETLIELPSLQILKLNNNKINGALDFAEYQFPNLETLELNNNEISKIIIRNDNLPQLRILRLMNNKDLKTLDFQDQCHNLKKINLMGNKDLKRIDFFDKLLNLRSLSFNGKNTVIRGDLPRLEKLRVEEDFKLEKVFSNSLRINKHLLNLSVRDCSIDSTFLMNLKMIQNFPHLQKINLSNNDISMRFINLVIFFQKFKDLKNLKLDNNPIVDDIKDERDLKLFKLMIRKLINN